MNIVFLTEYGICPTERNARGRKTIANHNANMVSHSAARKSFIKQTQHTCPSRRASLRRSFIQEEVIFVIVESCFCIYGIAINRWNMVWKSKILDRERRNWRKRWRLWNEKKSYVTLILQKKKLFLSVKIICHKIFRWKKSTALSKLILYTWYFLIRHCAWE